MSTFTIAPTGTFDLAEAAGFGFGANIRNAHPGEPQMHLAFCLDDLQHLVGVALRQTEDGAVHGVIHGDAPSAAVQKQVARVLSLDQDGEAWQSVVGADPVLGRVVAEHPGLRPVLFHLPYEAAAWSIISARVSRQQAAPMRFRIAAALGEVFELGGERVAAFPTPERLLQLHDGLPQVKIDRLHAVARAALAGELDQPTLLALDPTEAMARAQKLPGIGPLYAALIVIRGTGHADVLAADEPITQASVGHFYGYPGPVTAEQMRGLGEQWRPYRTWATVHLHAAGRRMGLGVEARRRGR